MSLGGDYLLEVKNLTKSFGGLVAVDDLSFEVKQGEIFGIIGPNGSGKTVTFEVISGFYRPTHGDVLFKGRSISRLAPHQVTRLGLARSFQVTQLFRDFNATEVLLLPALSVHPMKEARRRVAAMLGTLGLSAKADWPVSMLSISELKRLELGRVLSGESELLMLDEIMAGLDKAAEKDILDIVRRLRAEGHTFIIIEHRLDAIASICDRVLALVFGRKVAEGSPAHVMNDPQVVKAYIGGE